MYQCLTVTFYIIHTYGSDRPAYDGMAQRPGGEDPSEGTASQAAGELHERLSVTKGRRRDADGAL